MTPDRDADRHELRRDLASYARLYNWHTELPHACDEWMWLHLYHPKSGWRVTVEWADDLPGGCRMHLLNVGRLSSDTVDNATVAEIRFAITDPDLLGSLMDLVDADAADSDGVIDLRDVS